MTIDKIISDFYRQGLYIATILGKRKGNDINPYKNYTADIGQQYLTIRAYLNGNGRIKVEWGSNIKKREVIIYPDLNRQTGEIVNFSIEGEIPTDNTLLEHMAQKYKSAMIKYNEIKKKKKTAGI